MDCLRFANGHFGHFGLSNGKYSRILLAGSGAGGPKIYGLNKSKREKKEWSGEKSESLEERKREDARLLEAGRSIAAQKKSPKKKRKRRKKNEKKKKEEEEEVETEKEVEKPIVVRETKEICILSNCRLKVRERVWKHGGWKVEGGRAGQGGIG